MNPLNAMTVLWSVLVPLEEQTPDPNDVKPGWLGFIVFLLLLAAVVFLAMSFRKQLKKVNFEERDGNGSTGGENGAAGGAGNPNGGPGSS